MFKPRWMLWFLVLSGACLALGQPNSPGRLMRFPDVYKNQIVFSYAGDLWLVQADGGVARRITTSPGLELFPKFSPDGTAIAFTGQYDGNFNVYVIPSQGGAPRQLTFNPGMPKVPERMGVENEVITWFPDGKGILFLSRRNTFNSWFGRLFRVSAQGGLPEQFPLPRGGLLSFSPNGTEIAYNRIFRTFRTWKRYTGGLAQDIWIYNLKTHAIQQITHYAGTDTFPMWRGNTIYFVSDRGADHRENLYSYSLGTKQVRQLTHFADFDVEWPSLGTHEIVFENGGDLYIYDLKSEKSRKVTVSMPGDFNQARSHWVNVAKHITDMDLSPDGRRALFTARGDVFTVPAKNGSIRDITDTTDVREKYATWSPDGRWIAYVSGRSGEDEVYIRPEDGLGKEIRVTFDDKMFRLPPVWSPDSQKLLFADKDVRLFYVDIHAKKPILIDRGKYADLTEYSWSPDSKWVAYAKAAENTNSAIYLYSLADQKITSVTPDFWNSVNPVFDPQGRYLYFRSDRSLNAVPGNFDFEAVYPQTTRIYAVTLRSDLPSPFAPESDEVKIKNPNPTPPGPVAKSKAATKPIPFRIDLDGIEDRIVALPTPPGHILQLVAAKDRVYYLTRPISGLSGPLAGVKPALHVFSLKDRKDHVLISGVDGYALSFDGKKVLYSVPPKPPHPGGMTPPEAKTYGIIDAKPKEPHKAGEGELNLAAMQMKVNSPEEWKQIFNEASRQERDYFYEASMNGVNWAAVRDKYAALLPYVKDRYDLNYILGEMIGELANSHTYVGGGDYPDLHPVNDGLLGVDFGLDTGRGLYRFKKIYPGENWEPSLRSPLTEPGLKVKAGDYLLAVNGHSLRAPQNPYELFVNTANQNVTLTISSQPDSPSAGRNITVKPLSSEFGLRELDWITTNRRRVEKASGGKIGYVYLPDMEAAGLNEFVKQFYPQIRKEGLIIDIRYNGGGFVDQIILERLRRILAAMMSARNFKSGTIPSQVFNGYLACIANQFTASDGDFFSYFFKKYKLGPVIGERTWGGVRGIRGYIPMIDGGYITRPEFSLYNLQSQWIVENHGVQPDIDVRNSPGELMAGHDAQLEKAVQVLMQEIKAHPKQLPPRPPDLPAYPPGPA
ncbi:MAG TPA: S41 family peptidase [Terriglobia bacterium]|nr:S41 family peptidase [Terriglobia bacterium]